MIAISRPKANCMRTVPIANTNDQSRIGRKFERTPGSVKMRV